MTEVKSKDVIQCDCVTDVRRDCGLHAHTFDELVYLKKFGITRSALSKMRYEKFRIESFRNWPIPWISVKELAAAGFFYPPLQDTYFKDRVKCAFCLTNICNWEAVDEPLKEHKRWSPDCKFIMGEKCGNVPVKCE